MAGHKNSKARKEQRRAEAVVRQSIYDAKTIDEKLVGAGKRQTARLEAQRASAATDKT